MEESKQNKSVGGIASLVLGIIGVLAWLIPILGAPITIIGLILGIKGRKGKHGGLAIAGIVLCIIGLFATIINGSIGAYKGANGTLFQRNNTTVSTTASTTSENPSSQVIFCENIDNNLNPTNVATVFPAGQIYVKLQTAAAFKTTNIKVTVYIENGSSESIFDSSDNQVNQDWNAVAFPITLNQPGKYKVVFTVSSNDKKLGEGLVTIQ